MFRLLTLCIFLLFSLCSCGGGSVGTDGIDSRRFLGVVLDESGAVLSDVSIVVEETGDAAQTDENGEFQIDTTSQIGSEATLLVETEEIRQKVVITEIAESDTVIEVELLVSESDMSVSLVSISISSIEEDSTENQSELSSLEDDENSEESSDTAEDATELSERAPDETVEDDEPIKPSIIRGKISLGDGTLVSGARVTLLETGRSATTNGSGEFSIRTNKLQRRLSLQVAYFQSDFGNAVGIVTITGIPKRPVIIDVEIALELIEIPEDVDPGSLELSSVANVELDSVSIKQRN